MDCPYCDGEGVHRFLEGAWLRVYECNQCDGTGSIPDEEEA